MLLGGRSVRVGVLVVDARQVALQVALAEGPVGADVAVELRLFAALVAPVVEERGLGRVAFPAARAPELTVRAPDARI